MLLWKQKDNQTKNSRLKYMNNRRVKICLTCCPQGQQLRLLFCAFDCPQNDGRFYLPQKLINSFYFRPTLFALQKVGGRIKEGE